LDVFIAGLGTSGTLMGVSARLKEHNPDIKIIGVEPLKGHRVQGLKNLDVSYVPPVYDESKLDERMYVSLEDAEHASRMLSLREGIFTGMSAGGAMHVALEEARKMRKGTIVVILPDGGEKYISHSIYSPAKCLECTKRCKLTTNWDEDYVNSISDWWQIDNE
jgi:cysteine synthase